MAESFPSEGIETSEVSKQCCYFKAKVLTNQIADYIELHIEQKSDKHLTKTL